MENEIEYGMYVGKKTNKRSPKSGVPLWSWTLVQRIKRIPSIDEIKRVIIEHEGLMGYVMRLKPRPWKKVTETIKV